MPNTEQSKQQNQKPTKKSFRSALVTNANQDSRPRIITTVEAFEEASNHQPLPPRRKARDLDVLPDTGEYNSFLICLGILTLIIGGITLGLSLRQPNKQDY